MTRLLLSTSAAGGVPPDPPEDEPQDTYPSTSDPIILAARPGGRRIETLTVDTAFAESATNFHTINEAIEEAKDLQEAAIQQGSLAPGEFSVLGNPVGPDYSVDIIIAEGIYDEELGSDAYINLIGATGDPDDVVVETNNTGGGTFHPFGPCYVEGVRFNALTAGGAPDTGPKYPMHITTGGPGAVVLVNCKFISTNPAAAGSVGMDGGNGLFVYFYDCDQSHMSSGEMNLHGGATNTVPVTVVWENCTNNGDFAYDEIGSATDEVWVIGCTPNTLDSGGTTNDHLTGTPPRAVDAMSTAGLAYYYPQRITGAFPYIETFGTADQAAFSPPVGRIYYIPVDLPNAMHRTHHGVVANSSGGAVGIRSGRRTTPPATGDPGLQSIGTMTAGINDVGFYYYDTFYPGETQVYVMVAVTSGSPSLMGSLAMAAGAYQSDNNGATITAVPGGSRVPVVRLRSDS